MKLRKDADASLTIDRVKNILKKSEIKVIEKEIICHDNYWYSVRIELAGLDGIGVNGKGGTLELALASGYGELMERLQSGTLIDNLYSPFAQKKDYFLSVNELEESLELIGYKEKIPNFSGISNKIFERIKFLNWFSKEEIYMPQWFIDMDCMTNGLCAGNTFYEAVNQGIFEIFERNARRKLYEGTLPIALIDRASIRDLESYKMLTELEKLGFRWDVVDCTAEGRYPVLGIILWDEQKEHYLFVMGADIDIDICIQRCITELFQGRKINFMFKRYMENTYDLYEEEILNRNLEYHKTVLSNAGKIPYRVLFCNTYGNEWRSAFSKKYHNNVDVFNVLVNIIKKQGYNLYIKDMSYLGFPTYRVYIPGLTEVIDVAKEYIKYDLEIRGFTENICCIDKCTCSELKELISYAHTLFNMPFNNNISVMKRVKGIVLSENQQYILDNNYLLFLLYCKYGEAESAKRELHNFLSKYPDKRIHMWKIYVDSFEQMLSEYKDVITERIGEYITDLDQGYPICPDCENCKIKSKCKIEVWKSIRSKLQAEKERFER